MAWSIEGIEDDIVSLPEDFEPLSRAARDAGLHDADFRRRVAEQFGGGYRCGKTELMRSIMARSSRYPTVACPLRLHMTLAMPVEDMLANRDTFVSCASEQDEAWLMRGKTKTVAWTT